MIKATGKQPNGRILLTLGLSFKNLDKFYAEPGDTYIKIDGEQLGLPIDVLIFSGETEAHMQDQLDKAGQITPETKIHVDSKLKS